MEREQRTLLLKEMFGTCFTDAKQLWRASDSLLGEHCGTAPFGASRTSLHHG